MSRGRECHLNRSKPQNVPPIQGSLNYGGGSTNISIFQEWLIDRTMQNKQNRNSIVNVWNMTCIRMNQGLKLNFSWSNLTSSRGFPCCSHHEFIGFNAPNFFDNWNLPRRSLFDMQIFHLYSVPWKNRWGFRKITLFWSTNTFAVAKLERCLHEKCLIFQALASPKTNWNFPAWKFRKVLAHLELLDPAWSTWHVWSLCETISLTDHQWGQLRSWNFSQFATWQIILKNISQFKSRDTFPWSSVKVESSPFIPLKQTAQNTIILQLDI